MFFRLVLVLLAGILTLTSTACSSSRREAPKSTLKPASQRRPAPDFALKDINGQTVRLSDYRGKVVLLNFWATWCGPCQIEIPWLIEFEQRHKDRGFAVIGVSMDDFGWDVVRPFVARMGVNYRTLLGDETVAQLYGGVQSLPTTFMIDREGRIASAHLGLVSKRVYEREIEELLSDPLPSSSASHTSQGTLSSSND